MRNNKNIKIFKRLFDIIFSILSLILFLPFILLIILLIKITDRGYVFYTQERIGENGKKFKLIKFRTMYINADQKLKEILKNDSKAKEEWEKTFKLKNDLRITPVGEFLRKTSLDELPQFINVLKGEMSVVGPRPVVEEELIKYYKDKANLYKSVKPGITGYWQVEGRSDTDYDERIKMDEYYINNQSFLLDLKIILKTIQVMFSGKGAY